MKRSHLLLLAAALVVAGLFLSFSSDLTTRWQSKFLDASAPLIATGSAVQQKISAVNQGLKTLDELEAENRQLARQNDQLRAANQLLANLDAENRRLREALDYRERSTFRLLPAEVVARDTSSWWNTAKINRGFASGVESSQPVLAGAGLAGRTTTVAKNLSIVLLITDENCQVAARIEGTTEQGIVSGRRIKGSSAPELVMNFLTRNAAIQPGMKVVTAGVSGAVFPGGIPLGTVKEFRTRELDGQAVLEPAVDFSGLEDVFVVLGSK